jgi:TPR repeat protein
MRKLSDEEAKELEDALAQNGFEFDTQEEAETFFFAQRDRDLEDVAKLNRTNPDLDLNFKAKSLQRFEDFYFKCYVDKTLSSEISKERMEELLTQYMRQVFVSNEMAEWMVFENDFAEGQYELGLMYGYGSGTMENYAEGLDKREDNDKRTYLFDKFMLYVPGEREIEIL